MNTPNPREYGMIPAVTLQSIQRYVCHGIGPGDFLCAVLENDLREAVGRADEYNIAALPQIVMFLHNWVPGGCWGYEGRVKVWEKTAQEEWWQEGIDTYWPEGQLWPQRRI